MHHFIVHILFFFASDLLAVYFIFYLFYTMETILEKKQTQVSFLFLETRSRQHSSGCPRTCHADQTDRKLKAISCLHLQSTGIKGMLHHFSVTA